MSGWLDRIEVASPCHESWEEMSGDARERHCASCDQTVYDLAGLSRSEAEALVLKKAAGERVCVRFRRRADGTVLTADCPTQVREARRPWRQVQTVAASLLALAGGAFGSGCTQEGSGGVAPDPGGQSSTRGRTLPVAGGTGETGAKAKQVACCPDGQGDCCIVDGPAPTHGGGEMIMGEMEAPDLTPRGQPATPDSEEVTEQGLICLPDDGSGPVEAVPNAGAALPDPKPAASR